MKKILVISILFNIVFSFFIIMSMQQHEAAGAELELFKAIENGDVTLVQRLIDEGAEFRATRIYEGSGITPISPLDFAKSKGNSDIIEAITQAYKLTSHQRFLAAIEEGIIPKIENIIINGRITNVDMPKDKERNTALILAVQKKDVDLVQQLLLWKADINIQNEKGESAFTLALKLNKPLITALLENAYNIEIDQQDGAGNTPLILAVQNGDLEIIERIVDEVPNPDIENLKNEKAYNFVKDDTPNKTKILELLAKAKKQYALHEAIQNENFSVIKNSDAYLNITSIERNPLVVAISQKNKKLVEEIINKGANVNEILKGNRTPLWRAVLLANNDTFKFLLEKDAKPDVADIYDEYTPIFLALHNNKSVLVQYLIDNKVNKTNINFQASSLYPGHPGKVTPLMLAVQEGESDSVKILLDAGADPLLQNSEGKTALDLAQAKQKVSVNKERYQKIITLLEDKIKTILSSKPSTPTTSSQLMSLLQNLTQQLRILEKRLTI